MFTATNNSFLIADRQKKGGKFFKIMGLTDKLSNEVLTKPILLLTMYLRKKYPQETQNMPDGTIGFQHINEKWFKKLKGHKLSLVKAKNNVIEME